MSDPDAVTALYWLALFCASLAVGCLILRPRKRRNRYRTDVLPAPDTRCVAGNWGAGHRPPEAR